MSTLITKDMPEPKEYGPYLVTHPDNANEYPRLFIHDELDTIGHSWMDHVGWHRWSTIQREYEGCAIESLADHDARIRRGALTHLSMTDIDAAIRAYENARYTWDDNNMPLRMAFKAVAENRERVS